MSVWTEWFSRHEKRASQETMVAAINKARDDSARVNCIANRRNAGAARAAIAELLKKMEAPPDDKKN